MEIKKSPNADLENKRISFLLIGLVIVLALVYITLEWTKTEVVKYETSTVIGDAEKEELIPVTIQDKTPPPPPIAPPVAPPVEINIVDNTKETTGTLESSESDADTRIIIPPAPIVKVVDEDPDEQKVFQIVEKMPSYPGGDAEMMKFIGRSIRYPAVAQENGIEERIIVSFVVGRDGKITDAKIARGKDPSLCKEALRVVNAMPAWNAGEQRGKAVRVSYILPIVFKLSR